MNKQDQISLQDRLIISKYTGTLMCSPEIFVESILKDPEILLVFKNNAASDFIKLCNDESKLSMRSKMIISAYTGVIMCPFDDLHKFIIEIMGRPVYTHELADQKVLDEIREKVEPMFKELFARYYMI